MKFHIGQRVRVIDGDTPDEPWPTYGLVGHVVEIRHLGFAYDTKGKAYFAFTWYTVDLPDQPGGDGDTLWCFKASGLEPVDDDSNNAGSWDEIKRILGTDIRRGVEA